MLNVVPNSTSLKVAIILSFLSTSATAIAIDNGVISSSVTCNDDAIEINFMTRNPFQGRIFVKGMSERQECSKLFIGESLSDERSSSPTIKFGFGVCNMQKSRMELPQPGVMQSLVVIISFHKLFITKVDKAYRVQCFYMEAETLVTSNFEISMIPTDDIRDTGRVPVCTYQVRRESRAGPIVKYAKVGEPVYHEWECDGASHRILIKNCYVDDGFGTKYQILDDRGCNIDKYILPPVEYDPQFPKAWVEAHVFKYADKPTVSFQCSVQVCNKQEPSCEVITPPRCQTNATTDKTIYTFVDPSRSQVDADHLIRSKREDIIRNSELLIQRTNFSARSRSIEVSLTSDPITVIELDDGATLNNGENITIENRTAFKRQLDSFLNHTDAKAATGANADEHALCITKNGLIALFSFIALISLLSLAILVTLCRMTMLRRRPP